MRELLDRAYFFACLNLGRVLRSARYAKVSIAERNGKIEVRKRRSFYAPVLVWLGDPLVRILDTGVRVLPQRDWEIREQNIYGSPYDSGVEMEPGGILVLPHLRGMALAALLEDPVLDNAVRRKAITLAVTALSDFHRNKLTHGDAMAENVMIDLDSGVAHWFDFETVHNPSRPMAWRRADDLRALLTTCLLRTLPEEFPETLSLILDTYADERVTELLAESFRSVWQRPLTFHLGQSPLSYHSFCGITQLLESRLASQASQG